MLDLALAAIVGLTLAARERSSTRNQASSILEQARALRAEGDYDRARRELRAVLQRQPKHLGARRALANLESELGRVEHAYLELQTLTEIYPENAQGWLDMAKLLSGVGLLEAAEEKAGRAVDSDPKRADARKLRAKLRYRLGRYYGASLDAEAALQHNPADVSVWVLLSKSTARAEGRSAGLQAIKEALAAAGDHPALMRQKSRLIAPARGDADPQSMERVRPVRVSPAHATVEQEFGDSADRPSEEWLGQLAAIRQQLGRYLIERNWSEAKLIVDAARANYPATMFGPWLASIVAYTQGNLHEAETNLREALAIAPRSVLVVTALAKVWAQQHDALYAGDHLMRLAERDPTFAYPRRLAARAYLASRDPSRAEAALLRGLELQPSSPNPYTELANFYLDLDRVGDALLITKQGLERFPDAVNL